MPGLRCPPGAGEGAQLRLPEEKFLRERKGPGSARGDAAAGAAKHEAGKGAVFTSTPPKLVGAGFHSPSQLPEP